MSLDDAIRQFQENIQLLGGEAVAAQSQPEKVNLYKGLMNLARGLKELQQDVRNLKQRPIEI